MDYKRRRPIGIFDSGVGGLTVAKRVSEHLPHEDIVYFGDTARVPYGNKSRSTIIRFASEIMFFMMRKQVKMVIVACNTASSLSLSFLKRNYSMPVIGVINPGVKEAVKSSRSRRIGIIGTNSTVKSAAYENELHRVAKSYKIFSKSCPLFVPLVENKVIDDPITYKVAEKYLLPFKGKNIDTMILGCTHYPILKKVIKKILPGVALVDSSFAVAKEAESVLIEKGINTDRKTRGTIKCYVSDDIDGFRRISGIFFKKNISVKKVSI